MSKARDAYGTVSLDYEGDIWELNAVPRDWVARRPDGTFAGRVAYSVTRDNYAAALALIGLSRPHRLNRAVAMAREQFDDDDKWGSTLIALGALQEALDARQHGDAAGIYTRERADAGHVDSLAVDVLEALRTGALSPRVVSLAIKTLDRYADAVRAAGLDY